MIASDVSLIASVLSLREERQHQRAERRQEDDEAEECSVGLHGRAQFRSITVVEVCRIESDADLTVRKAICMIKAHQHEQRHRADDDEHHVLPQLAGLHGLAASGPTA